MGRTQVFVNGGKAGRGLLQGPVWLQHMRALRSLPRPCGGVAGAANLRAAASRHAHDSMCCLPAAGALEQGPASHGVANHWATDPALKAGCCCCLGPPAAAYTAAHSACAQPTLLGPHARPRCGICQARALRMGWWRPLLLSCRRCSALELPCYSPTDCARECCASARRVAQHSHGNPAGLHGPGSLVAARGANVRR